MPAAKWIRHELQFKTPGGTSRGVLHKKTSFILVYEDEGKKAFGECSLIAGLSPETESEVEQILPELCNRLEQNLPLPDIERMPALQFAVEMLTSDWKNGCRQIHFENDFTDGNDGVPINGLIWMSDRMTMLQQAKLKVEDGFDCLKLKVGALEFEEELGLIHALREEFGPELEIRLDANGSFHTKDALEKLKQLSEYDIHSIEQPIKPGLWPEMAFLCRSSPIPIALDEELIGASPDSQLLQFVHPQYIILKPSLLGGWTATEKWINAAEKAGVEWWATSALESNIGLNAIAQFTSYKNPNLPQGLGTGQLFTNNFPSPLYISQGTLFHNGTLGWDFSSLHGF